MQKSSDKRDRECGLTELIKSVWGKICSWLVSVLKLVPESARAQIAKTLIQVAKAVLGFGGVLAVVVATDYPAYNVLQFSKGCGEHALADLAYLMFAKFFSRWLYSFAAGCVCISVLPVRTAGLIADLRYDRAAVVRLYASVWTMVPIVVSLAVSVVFLWRGFHTAIHFLDLGKPGMASKVGGCPLAGYARGATGR